VPIWPPRPETIKRNGGRSIQSLSLNPLLYNAIAPERSRNPNCVTVPNFVEIGQTAAIFRFFKMAAAAILDFTILNFNCRNAEEGGAASPCRVLLKSVKLPSRYGNFSIFQDSAAAILDF